jgi:hypothetical protein
MSELPPFDDIHHVPWRRERDEVIRELETRIRELEFALKSARNIVRKSDNTIRFLRRVNRRLMDERWQALRMVPHYGVDLARETWDEDGVIHDDVAAERLRRDVNRAMGEDNEGD